MKCFQHGKRAGDDFIGGWGFPQSEIVKTTPDLRQLSIHAQQIGQAKKIAARGFRRHDDLSGQRVGIPVGQKWFQGSKHVHDVLHELIVRIAQSAVNIKTDGFNSIRIQGSVDLIRFRMFPVLRQRCLHGCAETISFFRLIDQT